MNNEKHLSFYKSFIDLIPEPLLIIEKKNFQILYANIEFQVHFKLIFLVLIILIKL